LSLSGQLFGGNLATSAEVVKRSVFGKAVMLVFVLTQVADGLFTYFGIKTFGAAIEGNPLVAWYVTAFGAGIAVAGAKGLALACGAALHLRAMHRTIGALTIIYLAAAVWPWFQIFTGAIAP
jgi:arginine exporter protein ArgO